MHGSAARLQEIQIVNLHNCSRAAPRVPAIAASRVAALYHFSGRSQSAATMKIQIRDENAADVAAIEAVTVAAFLNAPHTSHTEQFVVNALRRAGLLAISLVADNSGKIIGHVAVSPVAISDGASAWFGLGPVSVMPQHQRRGVGALLMRAALRTLRAQGAAGCVLLGEPEYYGRFGFQADANLILQDVPPQYFLAISFGASRPHGMVSYHEAFNARA
jgi:putative acetyltransferase